MYESFYKLSQPPFQLAPDPRYFFSSSTHRYGLVKLRQSLNCGDPIVVVSGKQGLGKTELLLNFASELEYSHFIVARVSLSKIRQDDFPAIIAAAFGVTPAFPEYSVNNELEAFIHTQYESGKNIILLIDDAHLINESIAEELELLCNIRLEGKPAIHCFLFGEDSIKEKLHELALEHWLEQSTSIELTPLKETETQDYIEHRLLQAGWQGDPSFSSIACELIHEYSEGIPRQINLLCNRALVQGCLEEIHDIDENLVKFFEVNNQLDSLQMPSLGSSNKVVGIKQSLTKQLNQDSKAQETNSQSRKEYSDRNGDNDSFAFKETVELDRPLYSDETEQAVKLLDVEMAFDQIYESMDKDGDKPQSQGRHVKQRFSNFLEKAKSRSRTILKDHTKDHGDNNNGLLDHGLRAMAAMYKTDVHGYVPPSAPQSTSAVKSGNANRTLSSNSSLDNGNDVETADTKPKKIIIDDCLLADAEFTENQNYELNFNAKHPGVSEDHSNCDLANNKDVDLPANKQPVKKVKRKVIIDDSLLADEMAVSQGNDLEMPEPGITNGRIDFDEASDIGESYNMDGIEPEIFDQFTSAEFSTESGEQDFTEQPYHGYEASLKNELDLNAGSSGVSKSRLLIDDYENDYPLFPDFHNDSAPIAAGLLNIVNNNKPMLIAVGASITTCLLIAVVIWVIGIGGGKDDQDNLSAQLNRDEVIASGNSVEANPEPVNRDSSSGDSNVFMAENASGSMVSQENITLSQIAGLNDSESNQEQFASHNVNKKIPTVDNILSGILERSSARNSNSVISNNLEHNSVNNLKGGSDVNVAEPGSLVTVLNAGNSESAAKQLDIQLPSAAQSNISKNKAIQSSSTQVKSKNKPQAKVAKVKKPANNKKKKTRVAKSKNQTAKKIKPGKSKTQVAGKSAKDLTSTSKPGYSENADRWRAQSSGNNTNLSRTSNSLIDRSELNRLMKIFSNAYEKGNIKQMRSILSSDVKSNEAVSKKQVESDFRKLFDITDMRKIEISGINWLQKDNKMQGQASFRIKVREKGNNRVSSYNGLISLDVEKNNKGVVIKRLDYHYL